MSNKSDVIIVGAGLAGLSAAVTLNNAGFEVRVVEGTYEVGGRVKTTRRDGFVLDHGFQVFNPAYKHAKSILDYSQLHLRKFAPGVKIVSESGSTVLGNPLLDPVFALDILKEPKALIDLTKFGLYCASVLDSSKMNIFDTDAKTALSQAGMSDEFITKKLQPFLSGVFLEGDLKTSRRFLDFVLQYFLKGIPALPSNGMASIPEQLANRLPVDSLLLGTWVHGINGTSVNSDAGNLNADHLIIATDQDTSSAWLGTQTRGWRSVTTWYHSTDIAREHLAGGKALLHVDSSKRGPVLNTIPLSHAAASYAPNGKHLISTSTLDLNTSNAREYEVRAHLAHIYGVDTQNFQVIDVFGIEKALPISQVPFNPLSDIEVRPNVYVASDTFTTPSIDGAIESGQKAAAAIIAKTR
jgi:phytoene dehydrogenase-like protein